MQIIEIYIQHSILTNCHVLLDKVVHAMPTEVRDPSLHRGSLVHQMPSKYGEIPASLNQLMFELFLVCTEF